MPHSRFFPSNNKMCWRQILCLNILCCLILQSLSFAQETRDEDTDAALTRSTCAAWSGAECGWEPNLKPMQVDFGGGVKETFYAYVTPDVSTFYNETAGLRSAVEPLFAGFFGKFVNLSPDTVRLFWESGNPQDAPIFIAEMEPFGSAGTATYPGHLFFTVSAKDASKVLMRWTMHPGTLVYYYDPFEGNVQQASEAMSAQQLSLYRMQLQNKIFAQQYRQFTGNEWLALYKQKNAPRFHMWRADAIGQTHVVQSKEIHFVEYGDELKRGTSIYGPRPDELSRARAYRARDPTLKLTLKVLSCAPRVFEIQNFLSDYEVEHILKIAKQTQLIKSTTMASVSSEHAGDTGTRTSTNSWLNRKTDIVIDTIYRRAADILQMNEALLRWRRTSEIPEFTESHISVAEPLQLVHYGPGQEYNAHHDFAMPGLVNLQPSRFATILFYLNDDFTGGQTAFPRWLNAETSDALTVTPEKGKAVLFYNLLPDGNYDERSQHAALPVQQGEKYLINLWVWDPVLDHTSAIHY